MILILFARVYISAGDREHTAAHPGGVPEQLPLDRRHVANGGCRACATSLAPSARDLRRSRATHYSHVLFVSFA